MRPTRILVLSLGLALGGGAAWLARGAGAADPAPAGARVAVVDLFDVLNASPRKRVVEQQRRDQKTAVETFLQEETNKLRDLAGEIEKTPKADPKRRKLEEDFARQNAMFEFEKKWRVAMADQAYGDALEGLYGEIRGLVRDVATEAGYSVVLVKSDDPLNLERANDFVPSIAMRPVIYSDRAIDITPLVKAKLEASRPPTPPAPPAPVPPAPVPPAPTPGPR